MKDQQQANNERARVENATVQNENIVPAEGDVDDAVEALSAAINKRDNNPNQC